MRIATPELRPRVEELHQQADDMTGLNFHGLMKANVDKLILEVEKVCHEVCESTDSVDLMRMNLDKEDLRGADLSAAMYVTQSQLNSAVGDSTTCIPERLQTPAHWA